MEAVEEKKLCAQARYYKKRYHNDDEFREKEKGRKSTYYKNRYQNDPEYREKMKANALRRHERLKMEQANLV
eukprot:121866-Hanusia_phi.AAC.1